ncbi:Glycosyltransferase 1 domain-containing protein 1 [Fasciola gigantica]|uniref:Glycosyltransferase 1 domain-containing protein 1 n=1 Tax=Fasciola gigantica TaxID=46835 RepID=A0A504YPI4_FASGI|nr:Glycosyltransferase 1 domain-containing protein 1 [Fasciola gigantica]
MICKIFCKGDIASGNLSTAILIREIIMEACQNSNVMIEAIGNKFNPLESKYSEVNSTPIEIAVLIHLRRCHEVFRDLHPDVPVIAVCGGTDLNEDTKNPEFLSLMTEVVERSKAVVLFSSSMLNLFAAVWPKHGAIITKTSPTVAINVDRVQSLQAESLEWLNSQIGVPIRSFLLIVGRLRPVKDPQYAYQPFLEWNVQTSPTTKRKNNHQMTSTVAQHRRHLIYIGSVEENAPCIRQFLSSLNETPYVHHVESIDKDVLHAIMLASEGLINCSISEGQSLTIMEALTLGTPVCARDIPGNRDLIQHDKNGLLFKTTEEFKQCLTRLCFESGLRERLIQAGKDSMHESRFQKSNQIDSYAHLFSRLNL